MEANVSKDEEERKPGVLKKFEVSAESLVQTGDNNGTWNFISWTQIPDIVIIMIFSLLSYKEALMTASTCSKWWRIFHENHLWRRLNIDIDSESALSDANKLVRCHGRQIRHLTIDASASTSINESASVRQLLILLLSKLRCLQTPRLTTLRIRHFCLAPGVRIRQWGLASQYPHFHFTQSLINFIGGQKWLNNVDLSANGFEVFLGLTLLKGLARASGRSITSLNITDFFNAMSKARHMKMFANIFTNLRCLRVLSTNYGCISNDFLAKLTESKTPLTNLSIRVRCNESITHRVHSATWRNLTNVNPNLRVSLEFVGLQASDVIQSILVPGIPLHRLEIWSGPGHQLRDEHRVPTLLAHIADTFCKTLAECSLEINNTSVTLDQALEHLIRRCSGLRSVKVNARVGTNFVANVCELRLREDVVLTKFHVTSYGASNMTLCELTQIREKYTPMIDAKRLDFTFHTDQ